MYNRHTILIHTPTRYTYKIKTIGLARSPQIKLRWGARRLVVTNAFAAVQDAPPAPRKLQKSMCMLMMFVVNSPSSVSQSVYSWLQSTVYAAAPATSASAHHSATARTHIAITATSEQQKYCHLIKIKLLFKKTSLSSFWSIFRTLSYGTNGMIIYKMKSSKLKKGELCRRYDMSHYWA